MMNSERIPWQESNLSEIGSDLDHKIKEAAAAGEDAWQNVTEEGLHVWRIEQFQVVPWPEDKYGTFYTGDSYIVMNTYKKPDSDALLYDVHIWIGSESSQDEYGTAAYKMVESDDYVGGAAIQHREVQGKEGTLFLSYFDELIYLEGGVASGFNHVEPSEETPFLYRVKGRAKNLTLTQMPLSKSSLNSGDSFILYANPSTVWLWNGETAGGSEKYKAISEAEKLCTQGTAQVMDQGAGDDGEEFAAFWNYLGDGEIQPPTPDDEVKEFVPVLYQVTEEPGAEPVEVATADEAATKGQDVSAKLSRSLLDESNVFLLDSGWKVYAWIGTDATTSEKLMVFCKGDEYCKKDPRTACLPLEIVKSGKESCDFESYFE